MPFTAHANQHASHPTILELFTSQGCSSCPPADQLASAYADDPSILVLSYHIDYWDRLGWKDPFSSPENTQRQHDYAHYLGTNIYTPQAIIQGQTDVVGSDAARLKAVLKQAQKTDGWVNQVFNVNGKDVEIDLPAARAMRSHLLLIGFRKHSKNSITSGENAGGTLSHRNNVMSIVSLGDWDGTARHLSHPLPSGDGVALLIQDASNGHIIGGSWK